MIKPPKIKYVERLRDLMTWEDYESAPGRKVLRFRLRITDDGLEIIGDSPYPHELEKLLAELGPDSIEMMLCG